MPVKHITLSPDSVATITESRTYDYISVLHRGNVSDDVWVTVNETDPVADGDDNYLVPAGARREFTGVSTEDAVRLLSHGAVKVEVEFT